MFFVLIKTQKIHVYKFRGAGSKVFNLTFSFEFFDGVYQLFTMVPL